MSANPSMMKHAHVDGSHAVHHAKPGKSIEYRVMYSLIFMVCLAIAGLCRLLPRNRHPWICADAADSASWWAEARSAADSTVPYVFQQ